MWRMDQHFERFRERGSASQAPSVRICARAFLVHDPADRRAGRSQASAVADRMGRRRPAAVLVGLSALGFRRSAFCLQDAADARPNASRSSTATPARSTSSDCKSEQWPVTSSPAPPISRPAATRWSASRAATSSCSTCQWRVLCAAQSLPACGRAARQGGLHRAADLAGARRLSALAGRRNAALSLARLGIRHAQRAVLVRSGARQGPDLSGRDRGRRDAGQGALRRRDVSGPRRGQLRRSSRSTNDGVAASRKNMVACYKAAPVLFMTGASECRSSRCAKRPSA